MPRSVFGTTTCCATWRTGRVNAISSARSGVTASEPTMTSPCPARSAGSADSGRRHDGTARRPSFLANATASASSSRFGSPARWRCSGAVTRRRSVPLFWIAGRSPVARGVGRRRRRARQPCAAPGSRSDGHEEERRQERRPRRRSRESHGPGTGTARARAGSECRPSRHDYGPRHAGRPRRNSCRRAPDRVAVTRRAAGARERGEPSGSPRRARLLAARRRPNSTRPSPAASAAAAPGTGRRRAGGLPPSGAPAGCPSTVTSRSRVASTRRRPRSARRAVGERLALAQEGDLLVHRRRQRNVGQSRLVVGGERGAVSVQALFPLEVPEARRHGLRPDRVRVGGLGVDVSAGSRTASRAGSPPPAAGGPPWPGTAPRSPRRR